MRSGYVVGYKMGAVVEKRFGRHILQPGTQPQAAGPPFQGRPRVDNVGRLASRVKPSPCDPPHCVDPHGGPACGTFSSEETLARSCQPSAPSEEVAPCLAQCVRLDDSSSFHRAAHLTPLGKEPTNGVNVTRGLIAVLAAAGFLFPAGGPIAFAELAADRQPQSATQEDARSPIRKNGQDPASPRSAPQELLVGLREGHEDADLAAMLGQGDLFAESIQRLHNITPVVTRFMKAKARAGDKGPTPTTEDAAFKRAYEAMPGYEKTLYRAYRISLPQGVSVEDAVARLQGNPAVRYAEPNRLVELFMDPNDPYYSSYNAWGHGYYDLWGLRKVQIGPAWDISQGQGVVVAVIDTGVDYNHHDIAPNMWLNGQEIPDNGLDDDGNGFVDDVRGWDFGASDSDPRDTEGHGTHVAGTIGAVGNNGIGVVGMAPQARIMAVKMFPDASPSGSVEAGARGVVYAVDNGAKVINLSWGGLGTSQTLADALSYAHSLGCVSVAAAGNDNADAMLFTPASLRQVITVAASAQNDAKCAFSNHGRKIDVAAPGGEEPFFNQNNNILSLLSSTHVSAYNYYAVGSSYLRLTGTSMAAPHVSGLAALILAHHPTFTNEEVRQVLRASADDAGSAGWDPYSGNGRVNAYNALQVDAPQVLFDLDGLAAQWSFDENAGTSAADSSGHGYTCSVNGAAWTAGRFGSSLSFDGQSSYADCGRIPSGLAGTMMAWVMPDGNHAGHQMVMGGTNPEWDAALYRYTIFAKFPAAPTGESWGTCISDGSSYQWISSGQAYDATNFPAGVWAHLAITYDGTDVRFYKDGTLISTVPQTVSGAGSGLPFFVGRTAYSSPWSGYFSGAIDEVKIYDRALTGAEIQAEASSVLAVTSSDPQGNAASVPVGKTITVSLNRAVQPGGNFSSIALTSDGTAVPIATTVSGRRLTIDPEAYLLSGAAYTVTVPAGAVVDPAGTALAADHVFTFTTLTDAASPVLVSTDPPHQATSVMTDRAITLAFNENIQPGMAYDGVEVAGPAGPVATTKSMAGNLLAIRPSGDLSPGTTYQVRIPAGAVSDLAGNLFSAGGADYVFTFTTVGHAAPVARWRFDENTGTVASDSSGNGHTGTVQGATWTTGRFGSALAFDGSSSYVDCGSLSSRASGTMMAWIKPAGDYSGNQLVMGGNYSFTNLDSSRLFRYTIFASFVDSLYSDGAWNTYISTYPDYGGAYQYVSSGQAYNASGFPAGVWTHLAVTYDGATVKFYRDGALVKTAAQAVSGTGDARPYFVGGAAWQNIGHPGAFFKGAIDEVQIHDRALTAAEVRAVGGFDTTPPIVSTTDPADGVTAVPLDKVMSVVFSEAVQPSTNYEGVTLRTGATVVPMTKNIAGNVLTITPANGLAEGTTYAVEIPAQAVKDLAAVPNELATAYGFGFSTAGTAPALVAYWNLDGNANDSSGNANDLTLHNDPAYTAGRMGQALELNGTDQYASRDSSTAIPTSSFSISVWASLHSTDSHWTDFFRRDGSWALQADPHGRLNLEITGIRDAVSTVALPLNTWIHLAVTYEAGTVRYYKDGVLADTRADVPEPAPGTGSIYVAGYPSWDTYLDGLIDEVKVWNRALSEPEVRIEYQAASAVVAHWDLDGNANDSSGNANDLTLHNDPPYTAGRIGQALELNGTDQYASRDSSTIPNSSFSISVWASLHSMDSRWTDFFRRDGSWALQADSHGRLSLEITGIHDAVSTVALPLDTWVHLTVTYDTGTVRYYKDGVLVDTRTEVPEPEPGTGALYFGGYPPWSTYLDGAIDQVKIWNRALSAEEVHTEYQVASATVTSGRPNLLASGGAGAACPHVRIPRLRPLSPPREPQQPSSTSPRMEAATTTAPPAEPIATSRSIRTGAGSTWGLTGIPLKRPRAGPPLDVIFAAGFE